MKGNIMKNLLAAVLLMLGTQASAQSDNAITWEVFDLFVGADEVEFLSLDVNFGTRFLAVNGVIDFLDGTATNVTGTCFMTAAGNAFCNLSAGSDALAVEIDGISLNGLITLFGATGVIESEGEMYLYSSR